MLSLSFAPHRPMFASSSRIKNTERGGVTYLVQYLIEHVGRQADHREIVRYQDKSEVDGLLLCHQLWPGPNGEQVAQNYPAGRYRGVHQGPVFDPLI